MCPYVARVVNTSLGPLLVTLSITVLMCCLLFQHFVCWIAGLPAEVASLKVARVGPAVPWLLSLICDSTKQSHLGPGGFWSAVVASPALLFPTDTCWTRRLLWSWGILSFLAFEENIQTSLNHESKSFWVCIGIVRSCGRIYFPPRIYKKKAQALYFKFNLKILHVIFWKHKLWFPLSHQSMSQLSGHTVKRPCFVFCWCWYHSNQYWFNSWLVPASYLAWDKVLVAILSW